MYAVRAPKKKWELFSILSVWNSLTLISDEEAAHQYQLLKGRGDRSARFDDKVYAFLLPSNQRF
jgi:hypothetical protein